MSVEIKNTKSASEKVIDNAGAVTGAKKSEYKFNDVTVTVPGSNLQVRIPPQETHTFDVPATSYAGIALNNAKKELGLDNSGDTPVESVIYVTVDADETISCDNTYEEIKAMADKGNVKAIVSLSEVEGETIVFEAYTEPSDKFEKYVQSNETYDGEYIQIKDIVFYGAINIDDSYPFAFSIDVSNNLHIVETFSDSLSDFKTFDIYLLDYNDTDKLFIEKINESTTSKYKYYVVMSANSISHLNDLFAEKGYEYKYIINLDKEAPALGEYSVVGQSSYFTKQFEIGESEDLYTGFFSYDYYEGDVSPVVCPMSYDETTHTLTLTDTDFTVPDIPTVDAEFTLHSDKTITCTGDGNAEGKLGELVIENIDGIESASPQYSISKSRSISGIELTDLVTNETITYTDCISYMFTNCYTVVSEDKQYDIVVWYENNQWNVGKYYK